MGKLDRLLSVTGLTKSGLIKLPDETPWLDTFMFELTRFPATPHDDQVDAFYYAIEHLRTRPPPGHTET